ncbi:MAG: ABC transporter ATP-binding protein [Anaerolineae bacterium]|nr:ABC transporter ATP-binding protein [Anaerolineae bacterium]
MTPSPIPRLEVKNITKRFPGVLANDNISLSILPGEIHALLGENGAGKTTLMNIVYGLVHRDSGEILINGMPVNIRSPREAIQHRVGMVHQHFMLVPTLTVAENVILGMRPFTHHLLDMREIEQDILKIAEKYGLQIKPSELISRLSVGEQQRVEIVKALYRGVDLLILDEPTAVLTPQETTELFKTIRSLTKQGLSIIFITHKLNEVMEVADRISVLRDGKLIATKSVQETDKDELAFLMVDRCISFTVEKPEMKRGEPVLVVKDLTVSDKFRTQVDHISFHVCSGEILGIAGVDGNGQNELALSLSGLLRPSSGKILLNGKDVTHESVRKLNRVGLGHIPADRQNLGLVMDFTVAENLILQRYYCSPFTTTLGFFDLAQIQENAQRLVREYDIRTRTTQTKLNHLSGGNQQKVILAREIDQKPKLLIAVQPTRGLDCGATEYIHQILVEQRNAGAAILLVSTELDEILALSDRICVMYEGKIMGELLNTGEDILRIGRLMAGVTDS